MDKDKIAKLQAQVRIGTWTVDGQGDKGEHALIIRLFLSLSPLSLNGSLYRRTASFSPLASRRLAVHVFSYRFRRDSSDLFGSGSVLITVIFLNPSTRSFILYWTLSLART